MARTVVVSGGGTGIGRAVARRFALHQDKVTIIGRRADVLATAAAEINAEAGAERVISVAADLCQPDQVEHAAAVVLADSDGIDVVVTAAGGIGGAAEPGLQGVKSDWEGEFRGNVLTAVLLVAALSARLRRPGATIVNVSSIAALAGGGDSYSAAKAAILGWTLDQATRYGPDGIRVNAVVPGYVTGTEFFGDRMTPERHRRLVDRTLVGRPGRPEDIAGAVFFLASPEATYITGQLLHVNGGALLGR